MNKDNNNNKLSYKKMNFKIPSSQRSKKFLNTCFFFWCFFRVLGAIIVVVGLYLVIWGKSNDQSLSSSNKVPIALVPVDQEMASRNDGTKTSGPDVVNVSGKTSNDEVV